jgi:hypothetical protein
MRPGQTAMTDSDPKRTLRTVYDHLGSMIEGKYSRALARSWTRGVGSGGYPGRPIRRWERRAAALAIPGRRNIGPAFG